MKQLLNTLKTSCASFGRKEDGSSTIDFMMILPVAAIFFAASFESGTMGLRAMMLERAVDVTVREVRTGIIPDPTHEALKDRICEAAQIIPDCMNQMKLEMVRNDIRNFVPLDEQPDCVDRAANGEPLISWASGGNNDLMMIRACTLFDPVLPTAAVGAAVPKESEGAYALVATSSFVLEPYQ